jgi:acyl-CoA synthetase (AMP-forming)/AMP-acid ligase II
MNLPVMFARCAERHAAKTAICWGELEISYAALLAQVKHVAARLHKEFDVKPGDRIALWVKNCPEFVPAVFGILSAGGVVVPVNNFLKPTEVSYILNDSGANVLITDTDLSAHFEILKAARPSLRLYPIEQLTGNDGIGSPSTAESTRTESDLAAIRKVRC